MQCPLCKEQIDDDSRYCDLCGEQILICSECGRPGKGKRCKFDGKELIIPSTQPAPSSAPVNPTPQFSQANTPIQDTGGIQPQQINTNTGAGTQPSQPTPTVAPPIQTPAPSVQTPPPSVHVPPPIQQPVVQSTPSTLNDVINFIGTGNGITFDAKDGDIIGRKAGNFLSIFATQAYVSGTHCKVIKINDNWHIQDLGSSNGTFVHGVRLAPNSPYPLTNNALVKIATLDFVVAFTDNDSTAQPQ